MSDKLRLFIGEVGVGTREPTVPEVIEWFLSDPARVRSLRMQLRKYGIEFGLEKALRAVSDG